LDNVIADAVSHLPQCTDSLKERDLTRPDPDDNTDALYLDLDNKTHLDCLFHNSIFPDDIIVLLEYSQQHNHQI
jgi:hypothetical protein